MKSPLRTLAIIITFCFSNCLQAIVVTNAFDGGSGSLRAAIAAAVNGQTITFDPALNGVTITLTSGELSIASLQVGIDASALPSGIKISGNANSRIFAISNNSIVTLKNLVLFNGKTLSGNGGGISVLQSQLNCADISILQCVSANDGGGLWANTMTGTIDRCSFLGNDSGGYGGGIFFIGATSSTIQNCVISGNRGTIGGGITNLIASPSIINCIIQGNSGSGIQLEFSSSPTLRNTIVWGNRTGDGSVSSQQIRNGPSSSANANVDYCLIEGVSKTLNNLDGTLAANDPQFINPANPVNGSTPPTISSDLRVFVGSPVTDVGNNASNPTVLDRSSKPRIQGAAIDLGAYEAGYVTFQFLYPSLSPAGDTNGNGLSNFLEYATGIDPTAPDSPSSRPAFSTSGGFNFLKTFQRTNAADVSHFWQTSTNLNALSWQNMVLGVNYTVESTSNPFPNQQQVVLKLLDGGNRRFYRQGFSNAN